MPAQYAADVPGVPPNTWSTRHIFPAAPARAPNGHDAAVPPRSVMNSRRLMLATSNSHGDHRIGSSEYFARGWNQNQKPCRKCNTNVAVGVNLNRIGPSASCPVYPQSRPCSKCRGRRSRAKTKSRQITDLIDQLHPLRRDRSYLVPILQRSELTFHAQFQCGPRYHDASLAKARICPCVVLNAYAIVRETRLPVPPVFPSQGKVIMLETL
jgi:hypothetical protein